MEVYGAARISCATGAQGAQARGIGKPKPRLNLKLKTSAFAVAALLCLGALAGCGQQGTAQSAGSGSSTGTASDTAASTATASVAPTFLADLNGDNVTSAPQAQDDFYLSVNYDWLQQAVIAPTASQVSAMTGLDQTVNDRLTSISKSCAGKLGSVAADSDEARIGAFYTTAVDMDARNAAGLGAAAPLFKSIEDASTLEEYEQAIGTISGTWGLAGIVGGAISGVSSHRPGVYTAMLADAPIIIDKSYYTSDDPTVRDMLKEYIVQMLSIYGYSDDEAAVRGAAVFDMLASLGGSSIDPAQQYNPDICSNIYTWDELKGLYSNVDIDTLFKAAKISPDNGVDVYDITSVDEAKAVNSYFTEDNLETLKAYSIFCLLDNTEPLAGDQGTQLAQYLGSSYRDAYLAFHNSITGITEQDSDENLAVALGNVLLATPYGKLYVDAYVDDSTKPDITAMIADIVSVYRNKLEANTWMSDSTKAAAIAKLDNLVVKAVYPDTWETWLDSVTLKPASEGGVLIDNALAVLSAHEGFYLARIGQQADPDAWSDCVQRVNASYEPTNNSITIPAGILQPPFYSADATHDANLGGIGAVIGHEISHAFDTAGSKYDETGALKDWWTAEDHATYSKLAESIVSYYERYEVLGAGFANGERTLGENIADLGGISCICDVLADEYGMETSYGSGTPVDQADADKAAAYKAGLQDAFTSYALIFCSKYTDAYRDYRMANNVHSLGYIRVNAVMSSTDAYYYAYDVQEGDGMYVAPESRVGIW